MPNWKKLRFKIEGKVNGVEMTALTTPMARLVEYLTDLAVLLGHRDSVHLVGVEDGSAQPVIWYDAADESRIFSRVQNARKDQGPKDANAAFKKIDDRLREDEGTAALVESYSKMAVVEFPGRNVPLPQQYGPIRERGSVTGQLMRVGGLDETVPIWIKRADGAVFYCDANQLIASQLAPFLYKHIRVHGLGAWIRDKAGNWKQEWFRIQSFDPEPLSDEGFAETIEKLRAIPGNDWASVEDPLEELRKIRHGEGKPTQ